MEDFSPDPYRQILKSDAQHPFDNAFDFEAEGMGHPVLVEGAGPGVILMHEMPGFVPQFWRLARWLIAAGYRVYAPALYDPVGTPADEACQAKGMGAFLTACISREIHLFARNHASPVTQWLRALARHAHNECAGPGVGVIGLCVSGNFAWSMALDPSVVAPVAGEPSLPLGAKGAAGSLHLSPADEAALTAREDLHVMALRFSGDPVCQAPRFERLKSVVGAHRLIERVMPDSAKNPAGNPFPHAVLTKDLIQADGEPTFEAAREVLLFLEARLQP
ncbi:dienelactone hydrolase family protein [Woodsholea maritima]|uniref:dienelactone hydrolase family protein n=1 Tax=Woodsholea maritima TaxID=240237 RepID=UPI00036C55FF|nr:dienelactone hydrolase family protein [Woodsholea maritima]